MGQVSGSMMGLRVTWSEALRPFELAFHSALLPAYLGKALSLPLPCCLYLLPIHVLLSCTLCSLHCIQATVAGL